MISLTITIEDLTGVLEVFDTVQILKWLGTTGSPLEPVTDVMALTEYTAISGTDVINSRTDVSDVLLSPSYYQYYFNDANGYAYDWYISRYYDSETGTKSGWSSPMQGETDEIYMSAKYPAEVNYSASDQLTINKIRLWIGDPINLRREYGEDAVSYVHTDGKTYELPETGWPAYINMGGVQFVSTNNPTVNGYKYLRFKTYINDLCTDHVTYSGICNQDVFKDVVSGIDMWYYTFRNSDKQIMTTYNNCLPPFPLTTANATPEAYMLQTAIDILRKELLEDATEDGASIRDSETNYNPEPGLRLRKDLLDDLQKKLDKLIKSLTLLSITGVLID